MKIAFVNSCLAPGKDGVGDYTQALAKECVRQGHQCLLIALNDRHVNQVTSSDLQSEDKTISCLRLPIVLPWHQRSEISGQALDKFAPDWVSLQFVPYAFQKKGIVSGLARHLKPLVENRKLHIMFHELWIGFDYAESFKNRSVGAVQRWFVLDLIRRLQPRAVHTSNALYRGRLYQCHVPSEVLSLFGSVPIVKQNADSWLWPLLQARGMNVTEANRHEFWLFGIFGALHPVWPPEPLFTYIREAARRSNHYIVILAAGRMGGGEQLWENLVARYASEFAFVNLREQPVQKISEYLNSLDFGIATSPYALIGKSSSVAAMLDHGLPVIVNRNELSLGGNSAQEKQPLLCLMDESLPDKIMAGLPRLTPRPQIHDVATQFLRDLTDAR